MWHDATHQIEGSGLVLGVRLHELVHVRVDGVVDVVVGVDQLVLVEVARRLGRTGRARAVAAPAVRSSCRNPSSSNKRRSSVSTVNGLRARRSTHRPWPGPRAEGRAPCRSTRAESRPKRERRADRSSRGRRGRPCRRRSTPKHLQHTQKTRPSTLVHLPKQHHHRYHPVKLGKTR